MTEAEKAELQKRTQSLYTSDAHLVRAATIHSNRHTLKRLLSTEDVVPDDLLLRLEVKNDPGKAHDLKVMLFHYPKFKGLISRFEFICKAEDFRWFLPAIRFMSLQITLMKK